MDISQLTKNEIVMDFPQPRFTRMLMHTNQPVLDDFDSWVFHPGMMFDSAHKWWRDFGTRDFPHEGIDLCLFLDRSMRTRCLRPETRVPAMFDGVVRAMFKDYLGQAIIVEHSFEKHENSKMLTVYAHTDPLDKIRSGRQVSQGDIIATIADTHRSKANILPHLHLSLAIPAPDLSYNAFVWNIMRDLDRITLLDPRDFLDADYHVLGMGSKLEPQSRAHSPSLT